MVNMRSKMLSSYVAVVSGAQLTLQGNDEMVVFKQSNAKIEATCLDSRKSYVSQVNVSGIIDSMHTLAPVSVYLNNVPLSCVGTDPKQPCASATGDMAIPHFYCEWSSPMEGGEPHIDGPLSASVNLDADGGIIFGSNARVDCPTPNPGIMTKVSGSTPGLMTLTLKHYVRTSEDSTYANDAETIPYQGEYSGNTVMVTDSMIIHPPPPSGPSPSPAPPSSPSPTTPNNCLQTDEDGIFACITDKPAGQYLSGKSLGCQACEEKGLDYAWVDASQNKLFKREFGPLLYLSASGKSCEAGINQAGACGWGEVMTAPMYEKCSTPYDCDTGNWFGCDANPAPGVGGAAGESHTYALCKRKLS